MRRRSKIIEPIVREIAVRYRDALLEDWEERKDAVSVSFTGRIIVQSRERCFDHYGCYERPDDKKSYPHEAVISIRGPLAPPERLRFPAQLHVLYLCFDDLAPDEPDGDKIVALFDETMRLQILDFIDELPPKTTLRIHCAAGISRSRAVAAAIRRLRGQDDLGEFVDGQPNGHVYRLMLGLRPIPLVWKIRDAIARDVVADYQERRHG